MVVDNPVPSVWSAMPFVLLLLAIALAPLVNKEWWEKYFPAVSLGLAAVTTAYYLLILRATGPVTRSALEFISFITLIGSLYVIAGGLHIRLRGRSTPVSNVTFLAIGALVANIVGTTGASMIMIRPFLRVNRYRIKPFHIVFFIFVISNVGGALTPIGDPPLFLGYLQGVPFFGTVAHLWYIWLCALAIILGGFYLFDRRAYLHLSRTRQHRTEEVGEEGEVMGWHNLAFLVVVLAAVFVTDPPFLREALMAAAACGSYLTTRSEIHRKNEFTFLPFREVAILFLGIFATMVPALELIRENAGNLGLQSAGQFYWATGALSSVLDNAPTYLNFLNAAIGQFVSQETILRVQQMLQVHGAGVASLATDPAVGVGDAVGVLTLHHQNIAATGGAASGQIGAAYLLVTRGVILQAISIGAVFFGAMTYIGNGPNLMVKSIAEQAGVRCPSFGAYVGRYAVPVLLPTFVLIWALFFRG